MTSIRKTRRGGGACGALPGIARTGDSACNSLFLNAPWKNLRAALLNEMDQDKDSLRFYFLGSSWRGKIEHWGVKPGYDPEGPLIF